MTIGQVMIHVTTLDKARAFYIDTLGLKVKADLSSELGMLIMENEGCFFTIHQGYKPAVVAFEQCKTAIILKVDDIEKSKAELTAKNVEMYGDINETPVHRYQVIKDFDGNWIEVAQFKS
ncbi:MAG: hypothetical protein HOE90_15645 [Bacteriovoracaceae bacterium]|jgi:predicted enzyme related to lactoylglutathione lyase|nr:hypothetical protein [Bacteriovoracaceae bacterium]